METQTTPGRWKLEAPHRLLIFSRHTVAVCVLARLLLASGWCVFSLSCVSLPCFSALQEWAQVLGFLWLLELQWTNIKNNLGIGGLLG